MRTVALIAMFSSSLALAACRAPSDSGQSAGPTYNKDIAPLLWERCGACHRPGQLAPFSLLEYSQVRSHAAQIVKATRDHVMPPWLPERGYGTFANDRRLSQDQIDLIDRWAAHGAPEGAPAERRSPPAFIDGWQLGQPDLVVELPEPYTLRPGHSDAFRNFVIPIPLSTTRYVRGMEVRPGNAHVVHHATIGIDRTRVSRLLDDADPEPGYEGMFSEGAHSPENHALGWTPGMMPMMEPSDMAWRLDGGSDLIIQLHMMPGHLSAPAQVRPSVGFFFTDTPPVRQPIDFKLGSKTIDIPAGRVDYTTEDVFVLPVDVDLLSVYPHAHYLARDMKAFATLPDGQVTWLLWIKDWNFNWQDQYRYRTPVFLPHGTSLTMRYTYDNSAANPRNPHRPPERVVYGPQSSDEMGDLWLRFLPRTAAAQSVLAHAFVVNELRKDIIVAEQGVARNPDDARWHNLLGARYVEAGRIQESVSHLERAVRLAPRDAEARNNLAQALLRSSRVGDAIAQYRQAARLAPKNGQLLLNLAGALQDQGHTEEAIRYLRQALAVNPTAEGYNNLGAALASRGWVEEAAGEFRRALELRPDYAEAKANLAMASELQQGRPGRR
jgi:Flp pilus assembly protein TadD